MDDGQLEGWRVMLERNVSERTFGRYHRCKTPFGLTRKRRTDFIANLLYSRTKKLCLRGTRSCPADRGRMGRQKRVNKGRTRAKGKADIREGAVVEEEVERVGARTRGVVGTRTRRGRGGMIAR
jgi:hypothetical protein